MGRAVTILGFGVTAQKIRGEIEKHCIGEIWSVNNCYMTFPHIKFDRVFEMHSLKYLKTWKATPNGQCHLTRLDMLGCPIYTQEVLPVIKNQRLYPAKEVFLFHGDNYFLGSPSLALALALYEGVTEVRTFGIDTIDESHKQQRASWAYWVRRGYDLGVRFSGTAELFRFEPDNDAGLDGLRERVGDEIVASQKTVPASEVDKILKEVNADKKGS